MIENEDEKDKRKKILNQHEGSLQRRIKDIKEIKQNIETASKEEKELYSNLDRAEENTTNEINFIKKNEDHILNLYSDNWNRYHSIFIGDMQSSGTYNAMIVDAKDVKVAASSINATSSSGQIITNSNYYDLYSTLINNYASNELFVKELKQQEPSDNFWENIDQIKNEMDKIISGTGDHFEKSIKSFISEPSNGKYKRLMDVRQSIFDNFLNKIVPNESCYNKLLWFTSALPRTPRKGFRYCQSKFYIQDTKDEGKIPFSTYNQIHNISSDMSFYYKELSDRGHNVTSDTISEGIIRKIVVTFLNVLTLKNEANKIK